MAEPETDYAPLLPVGLHSLSMEQLRDLCVLPFPTSVRRRRLMSRLEDIVQKLEAERVEGCLWIDGSFLTEKFDPNDVDLVLVMSSEFMDNATAVQQMSVFWVKSNLKASHDCDSFLFIDYPISHRFYYDAQDTKQEWLDLFGRSINGTHKGIAVIKLSGGSK